MKSSKLTALCLLLMLSGSALLAQVRMPRIFSNHMVMQQKQPLPVWGWAAPRERITVSWDGEITKIRADKTGKWRLELPPQEADGIGHTLAVAGKNNSLTFDDILIGEVWICSGQSNMEWSLSNTNNAANEIKAANFPQIRLFNVDHNLQIAPVSDLPQADAWEICSPRTVAEFSSVGYFFGRHLNGQLNVPIGLISTNWGGTIVETWTSREAITAVDGFEKSCDKLTADYAAKLAAERKALYESLLAEIGETEGGLVDGNPLWAMDDIDASLWKPMELPNLWESQGLGGLDGVVWFRKTVTIPGSLVGRPAILHLGMIDDSDKTWVNGQLVGETKNKYNALRVYELPKGTLKGGENTIAFRVEDYGGGGGLWGDAKELYLQVGSTRIDLAGSWTYRVSPQGMKLSQAALGPNDAPTLLFNGMINPLIPYAIQGAIWYQGESNAGQAYAYRTLFPTMIKDWRQRWGRDFPFLWVQLANFKAAKPQPGESDWAELREAQSMTLSLPNTGQAVIIDIGEADDIHPRNKQDVGYRLGVAAEKVAYGRNLTYSGPTYKEMRKEGNRIILTFDHIGKGLGVKDKYGYVKGFAIAGADKKWAWAKAELISDREIAVSSPLVKEPVAVRYGWADNPDDANLYNAAGLPASPFRTDSWKGITE